MMGANMQKSGQFEYLEYREFLPHSFCHCHLFLYEKHDQCNGRHQNKRDSWQSRENHGDNQYQKPSGNYQSHY